MSEKQECEVCGDEFYRDNDGDVVCRRCVRWLQSMEKAVVKVLKLDEHKALRVRIAELEKRVEELERTGQSLVEAYDRECRGGNYRLTKDIRRGIGDLRIALKARAEKESDD